jgi:NADH-quinone oxidoreductase subunit H
MKTGYSLKLGDIILNQQPASHVIGSVSGAISFIVMLLCVQAKVGFVPFDMAEAETEIIAGPCIEYSGKALGLFKLAKAVLTFAAPALLMTLYFGGISLTTGYALRNVLIYLSILVLMVVIKNTNPRVRIDQAVRFFWGPMTGLAVIAVELAYLGR